MSPKSVVVTGASSGIGLASAVALAHAGFDVIGTARTGEKARALAKEAERTGARVRTVLLDVADADSAARAFAEVDALTGGGPWAVVNNAGIAQIGAVEDVDDEAARRQLETNLLGPARIARLVLPGMRRRGGGRIVNVSSFAGRVSMPFAGWYCASKQGLAAMSDALRMEAAPFGVRVVVIDPGAYATGIWADGIGSVPGRDRSVYRESYDRGAREVLAAAEGLPGPEPVARAVVRALTAARPRPRYLVADHATRAQVVLDALAPTAVTDWGKSVSVGLRTPPRRLTAALERLRGGGR